MRCGVVPALRAYVGTRPMRRAVEAPARAGVSERSQQALPGRLFTHAATPVPASRKDV